MAVKQSVMLQWKRQQAGRYVATTTVKVDGKEQPVEFEIFRIDNSKGRCSHWNFSFTIEGDTRCPDAANTLKEAKAVARFYKAAGFYYGRYGYCLNRY